MRNDFSKTIRNAQRRWMPGTLVLAFFLNFAHPAGAMQKWLYLASNLLVDDNVKSAEALFARASKAGYTHVLLADSKFSRLNEMWDHYFANIDRIKQAAAANHIEVVPAVFPVGYSNDILGRDPNLIEGLPVKNARFVVHNGQAEVESNVPLRDGNFQDPRGWEWKDDNMIVENGSVHVTNPNGKLARIVQKLKLEPYHEYHIELEVKTEAFEGQPEVKLLAGEQSLNWANLGTKATQDWTVHHVVFNSLSNTQANLYLGEWGANHGTLAFRNVRIHEAGLVNLIRRTGAPFTVSTSDGRTLNEGVDFEPVSDPLMGTTPWAGEYTVWHKPPAIRTKLPEGTELRVSYYHGITVYDGQAMICVSEPKTLELFREQAIQMHRRWGAKGYMMSFDEIRVMNWCDACQKRHQTPGQMLAKMARDCETILGTVNPGGLIYTWSDMFDPFHNAHDKYFLVNGTLSGSWEGLSPHTIILPWYYEKRTESLGFFAKRGHHQVIAGYYDHDPADVKNWLEAASHAGGVDGVMYTTWVSNFADLEKFAGFIP